SMTIPAGAFVGVVGETGAGKSTLIGMIARFYDVTEGAVRIDGTDVRLYRQCDIHRIVTVVQQEVNLFTGTVADNIRLFRQDISWTQVKSAAQLAGAHGFIRRLPQGYRTRLSPHGSNLSLGQRQLLAFARAIVLEARVLILDEATANLDSETEQLVQASLAQISQGRTTIVIAHRLSTIRRADCIYVMAEGRVVESGSHDTLMARHGTYARLVQAHVGSHHGDFQHFPDWENHSGNPLKETPMPLSGHPHPWKTGGSA
ncbi:MAG: ATP-binding cassette domain-containing protein, partial [Firmicutes bacterium]|nr:ATP-binding cassette domain-containing protein [Bacillota bacterium]